MTHSAFFGAWQGVVASRVEMTHVITVVSLLKSLFGGLDVNSVPKVVMTDVCVLEIRVGGGLSPNDRRSITSGSEHVGSLSSSLDAFSALGIANGSLHGVSARTVESYSCVQSGK